MSDNVTEGHIFKGNVDELEQSSEEKMRWLRERGVEIETVEERRAKEQAASSAEVDPNSRFNYIRIPALSTTKLSQHAAPLTTAAPGDKLPDLLKPLFADGKSADQELLAKQLEQMKTTNVPLNKSALDVNKVSTDSMDKLIAMGACETFPLVHPMQSNKGQGVNIYLDEAGMLKKLPLNVRATELARSCGYNPPPTFYGDVFVGRVASLPSVRNVSFEIEDMDPNSEWMKRAMAENVERQMAINSATGSNQLQGGNDGEDGVAKEESGYQWTQTNEEIEVVVDIGELDKKAIKAVFLPQSVKVNKGLVLSLETFGRIDPDGCTWTLEKKGNGEHNLIITLEKVEEASWPRISK